MKRYYRQLFKLNSTHSIDGNIENKHGHTFTLTLVIASKKQDGIVTDEEYKRIETYIDDYLRQYSMVYLNDIPIFKHKLPTIEIIGETFYDQLSLLLAEKQIELLQLEIGETPVRIYMISSCILLPSQYGENGLKNWEKLLEKKMMMQLRRMVGKQ